MPTTPALNATVKITVNSVAKQFNAVSALQFDYAKGMVRVTDATGEFYFTLLTITTLTYTVVSGTGGSHTVVMS